MIPAWLRSELDAHGGTLSVARFMSLALHHPQHGYYARHIGTVGSRGDFATSATLSPLLGQALAAWLRDQPCRLPVIEVGAGTGALAQALRAALGWRRWITDYHIVESSAPLAQQQKTSLGRTAHWHNDMADALRACRGHAHIIHNELVDAFPAQRWQKIAGIWHELGVCQQNHALRETTIGTGTPPSCAASWPLADGQIIETHASYRDWLAGWRPLWRAGHMLTIDYGAADARLYHRRPNGTLRAYLLQQRIEGPEVYQNVGRQDITADVNFADLAAWGEALGLRTVRLATQAGFLTTHLGAASASPLADPQGAGGAFLVLEQAASK